MIKDKPARGVTVGLRKSTLLSSSDSFLKTVTDADGVYRITDVAPGSYLVTVAAPGFIISDSDLKPVVVGEGENVDSINFSLVRGGVITGKVTDGEGRPVISQPVYIIPADVVDGQKEQRPQRPAMTGRTDDRGIYRVFGVRPGRYKVTAGQGEQTMGVYYSGQTRYKQVFHPDVTDAAKATVIEVTEGSEATKVDIALGGLAQTYSVSGRVVNEETGAPVPNLTFTLRSLTSQRFAYTRTDDRGAFVMEGLTPSRYGFMLAEESSGLRGDKVTVEVIDRDLEDVTIKLSQGLSISGVVILETQDKSARSRLSELRLQGSNQPGSQMRFGSSDSTPISADGSFTLKGLAKGRVNFWLAGVSGPYPPKGFGLSRIERDGVATTNIDLTQGQNVTGVKVFISYGTGGVRGVVSVTNGTLPPGARIYLRLAVAGENPVYYRNAAPDERGRYVIEGVSSGLYEILAFVVGPGKPPKPVKQQISLSDGVTTEVNLTIDLAVPEP